MPTVRSAVLEDCHNLAPNLRPADAAELRAFAGYEPLEGLVESFKVSAQRYVIEHEGEVLTIFGASPSPHDPTCGLAWMMASTSLEDHSIWFLRNTYWMEKLVDDHYDWLFNFIDIRNEVHMKWLRWCGWEFGAVHENFGVEGRPFQEIYKFHNV
ncbi:hypothetical protein GTQ45_01985 [Pyruvatibacter mobilis]|uniref:N-acetyltransferase domain-containing protein n=1 Tax=Pyruvatibacter mobilis TaxID=1712261 RepID=A0A845Q8U3_9HYPH|nr:hypothetical protein [Pyruvatibacter mobilis]NBG94501.1 hypothetical protein [Pyruvatibacter mobilis]QJD74021.1 hypothetical protein HG718_00535 [Pyruvatibacter mobilis]GGD03447.1 hypothetical protein GCM10011587_03970 [Pyruvatibacter mobilis]